MHTVINVFNIHLLKDIVEFSYSNFGKMPDVDMLDYPDHMSLKNLESSLKIKLSNVLKHAFDGQEELQLLIEFINQPTTHSYTLDQIIDKEKENDILVNTKIDKLGLREVWNSF